MRVKLERTEDIAQNMRTFWFSTDPLPRYTAGQFIELVLPHENTDERGNKRYFSLSSSPSEKLLAVTTKFATDKSSSFKKALRSLTPGSEVTMIPPMGDFVLPKNKKTPLLFIAAGIGVTPMRSMVKWLVDSDQNREIRMMWGVNSLEEAPFYELFKGYVSKMDLFVSNPSANWKGRKGQINTEAIIGLSENLNENLIYLSGPEPMVEAIDKGLKASGINPKQIISDYFSGYVRL